MCLLRRAERLCPAAVAGDANAVEPHGVVDFAHEVGGEHHCAVDEGDDGKLAVAVDGLDFAREGFDALLDLRFGKENLGEVGMQLGGLRGRGHGR